MSIALSTLLTSTPITISICYFCLVHIHPICCCMHHLLNVPTFSIIRHMNCHLQYQGGCIIWFHSLWKPSWTECWNASIFLSQLVYYVSSNIFFPISFVIWYFKIHILLFLIDILSFLKVEEFANFIAKM